MHHLWLDLPGLPKAFAVFQVAYVGVSFFFVLSGFVLTYAWGASSSAVVFYLRRAARVLPLHVLTALTMAAMLWRTHAVNWDALPVNLLLLQAWVPDPRIYLSFVGAAWSLSCEAFFYACFPLLMVLLRRCRSAHRWALWLTVGALLTGSLVSIIWPSAGEYLYHFPLFRFVDFAVGALLCQAMKQGWRVNLGPRGGVALVATVYLLVLLAQGRLGTGVGSMWLYSELMVLPFGVLVVTVVRSEIDGASSVLRSRWQVALGQWSFGVYLLHGVLLAMLMEVAGAQIRALVGPGAVMLAGAVVALVVTSAWLVFVLYERPIELAVRNRWARDAASLAAREGAHASRRSLRPARSGGGAVA